MRALVLEGGAALAGAGGLGLGLRLEAAVRGGVPGGRDGAVGLLGVEGGAGEEEQARWGAADDGDSGDGVGSGRVRR